MTTNTLLSYLKEKNLQKVQLHLGCGGIRWLNFVNVDLYGFDDAITDSSRSGCVADVFADMQNLGLPNGTIDEIFTSHTVDHFTKWQAADMLRDWHRMLKPGGKVVLEMADFNRIVLWLFHPRKEKRELARTQFYGNQWDRLDFQTHRYVWSARELKNTLIEIGYSKVSYDHKTLTHHPGRDMRIIAIK